MYLDRAFHPRPNMWDAGRADVSKEKNEENE